MNGEYYVVLVHKIKENIEIEIYLFKRKYLSN